MDLTEEREADSEADAALIECAHAARTHAFNWTAGELRQLYGRSADSDYAEKLARPPFDVLSPYQVARVRAWHLSQNHSLATRLRLAAEYAGTGDWEPAPEAATLRAIAARVRGGSDTTGHSRSRPDLGTPRPRSDTS